MDKQPSGILSKYVEEFSVEENLTLIDEKLEELELYIGRKLTHHEEDRVLEIVDKYTPTGKDGKYSTDLFPFDRAWRIYESRKKHSWTKFLKKL